MPRKMHSEERAIASAEEIEKGGVGPGDAVLTVPTSVLRRQAQSDHTGVLADVDEATFNVNVAWRRAYLFGTIARASRVRYVSHVNRRTAPAFLIAAASVDILQVRCCFPLRVPEERAAARSAIVIYRCGPATIVFSSVS